MALTAYPWDEKYVVPGGAGANDGTSFANGWDASQVAANLLVGRRMNFAGNFASTGALAWNFGGGTIADPNGFLGWKSDQSAPAVSFSDMPSLDAGGAFTVVSAGNYSLYKGLRIGGGSSGVGVNSTDRVSFELCEIDNNTGDGVVLDNEVSVIRCRIHDNGGIGISGDVGLILKLSEVYDNSGDGVNIDSNNCMISQNFIARNGGRGISTTLTGRAGYSIDFNTIDDNGSYGLFVDGSASSILYNLITNHASDSAISAVNSGVIDGNNLYNNATDGGIVYSGSNTALNPQYVNVANNDYEIQNASLMNLPIPLLGNRTIGAWQPDGGGGGGGGGMLVQTGMSGGMRG